MQYTVHPHTGDPSRIPALAVNGRTAESVCRNASSACLGTVDRQLFFIVFATTDAVVSGLNRQVLTITRDAHWQLGWLDRSRTAEDHDGLDIVQP